MKYVFMVLVFISLMNSQVESLKKIKIDRKTESMLSTLFEKRPQNINVFLTQDSTYLVEAGYEDVKLVKRLTIDEYQALLVKPVDKFIVLENARMPYLIGQTSLGCGLYSWALPAMFAGEGDISKTIIALGLLTPLVYAGCLYGTTTKTNIAGSSAYGGFMGGIEGAVHGMAVFNSERAIFPVSLAENFIDYSLGQSGKFTPAMFQRKFNHFAYGYGHYTAFAYLFGIEDEMEFEIHARIATVLSMTEGYASLLLSRNCEYLTFGDALFELRSTLIGAQTIPAILASVDMYNDELSISPKIYVGTGLAGFAVGYYIGSKLSQKNDLGGSAGFFTLLLPYLLEGAVGGIGVLINSEDLFNVAPAVFAVSDFGITYYLYKALAKRQESPVKTGKIDFNIQINPMAVLALKKDIGFEQMPNTPIFRLSFELK